MIASSFQVLEYCEPTGLFDILDAEKQIVFGSIAFARLTELAEAGQICAYVRGARLRWIELIVPLSEVKSTERARQASRSVSDAIAQDCRTITRGHDICALDYTHNQRICQTYGSPARQLAHRDAGKAVRLARATASNRPVVPTFTQRASLADRISA